MNRATLVALSTATVITSAAAIGIGAAGESAPPPLTHVQYQAALARADASREQAVSQCAALRGPARDACEARANAEGMTRVAQLEERYRRTPQAAREAQRARIEARYQVARALCAALHGFENDQCLIRAHAARGRALLESQAPYSMRVD